jgi:Molybdopterin biosynthesis enzymes
MTDIPRVGLLCVGNNTTNLTASIFCAKTITKLLKESGYAVGGYYTMMIEDTCGKERAKEKLRQLCLYNNLAVTLGCDGFSPKDVMPDITKSICDREAPFFALHLCGAANIHNYAYNSGNTSRLLSERQPHSSYPSRSTAGICGNCLVLNLSNDEETAKNRLSAILPMLNFALVGICGRSADGSVSIEKNLISSQPELFHQQNTAQINISAI